MGYLAFYWVDFIFSSIRSMVVIYSAKYREPLKIPQNPA